MEAVAGRRLPSCQRMEAVVVAYFPPRSRQRREASHRSGWIGAEGVASRRVRLSVAEARESALCYGATERRCVKWGQDNPFHSHSLSQPPAPPRGR